jgi:quercetin dioxygenase-like cupin family protein
MARAVEIDSNRLDWVPTKWPGIARKLLRNDATTGARTVLLKFDANTRLPRHMHPAGEEVFVLEGRVRFEETWYDAGFYLYSPPGTADDVFTDTGTILLVALPKPHVDLEC